jgi:hypothetical protein
MAAEAEALTPVAPAATPLVLVNGLYEQLRVWDELCQAHGITYWAIGGTLLGQLRHGSIIPWDDDADVGVPREDAARVFQELRPHLRAAGIELWNTRYGYKLFNLSDHHVSTDVFIYERHVSDHPQVSDHSQGSQGSDHSDDSATWVLADPEARCKWPLDWFHHHEVKKDSLERAALGTITVVVPKQQGARRYCETLYGLDVWTMVRQYWDHSHNVAHKPQQYTLSEVMRGYASVGQATDTTLAAQGQKRA